MNFLKKVFGFIIDFTIGPVLNLRNVRTMTLGQNIVNAVGIAARGVVAASFFTAVPAFLVKLALLWIFGIYIVAGIMVLGALVGLFAVFGYGAATADKTNTDGTIDDTAAQPAV